MNNISKLVETVKSVMDINKKFMLFLWELN